VSLKAKIEAVLFLSEKPLSAREIAIKVNADLDETRQALLQLIQEYELRDTGLEIDSHEGYSLFVKAEYEQLSGEILPVEMKTGCLRTLSAVALKEPIYQSDLVKIRGGGVYEHLKELEDMGLIKRTKEGSSNLVRTTKLFAEYFKLSDDGLELQKQLSGELLNLD
jgi:segregation and condensation protein B